MSLFFGATFAHFWRCHFLSLFFLGGGTKKSSETFVGDFFLGKMTAQQDFFLSFSLNSENIEQQKRREGRNRYSFAFYSPQMVWKYWAAAFKWEPFESSVDGELTKNLLIF